MPKMIPSRIPEDTKSLAERKLFYVLQGMDGTDDWTIMHSVGIANHPTQIQGEADFLVVIPNHGIFTLEVKGGGISYKQGTWYSKDRYGEEFAIKNPIEEANNAMHAFADFIKDSSSKLDGLNYLISGYGVVFPDSEFHNKHTIPDIDDIQIADKTDSDDSNNLKQYLLRLAKFWSNKYPSHFAAPNLAQCKRIVELLRPNFDAHVSLVHQIKSVENQSITLTENQQDIFEGIRDNERCLVRGGAGTGKTLIAVNLARDLADSGQRVGLFCYNTQLAEYLNDHTVGSNIAVCDSFTEYMLEVSGISEEERKEYIATTSGDIFYRKTLPELFVNAYIDKGLKPFDYLIFDEAQDLMIESYLDTMDMILEGGLAEGNWCMFMDAANQNIFYKGLTYEDIKQMLKARHVFYARFELRDNCRNSVSIIKELDKIFGSNTRYPKVDEQGSAVVIKTYKKNNDQGKILEKYINELLADGVKPESITILSPLRINNSVVGSLTGNLKISEEKQSGYVYFSTIDSFKGLENSVIILVDLFSFDRETDIARLYVGMTRARSVLCMLVSENGNKGLNKIKEVNHE